VHGACGVASLAAPRGATLLPTYGDPARMVRPCACGSTLPQPQTPSLDPCVRPQVTPTFALYRGGSQVGTVTGVSDVKLLRGIVDALSAAELAGHEEDVFELETAENELAAQEASGAAKH
jgi:hypothetical protein